MGSCTYIQMELSFWWSRSSFDLRPYRCSSTAFTTLLINVFHNLTGKAGPTDTGTVLYQEGLQFILGRETYYPWLRILLFSSATLQGAGTASHIIPGPLHSTCFPFNSSLITALFGSLNKPLTYQECKIYSGALLHSDSPNLLNYAVFLDVTPYGCC
jgi:hypothetical protein